jgi:S1-C subfamily serine protease
MALHWNLFASLLDLRCASFHFRQVFEKKYLMLLATAFLAVCALAAEPERSVVQIFTVGQQPSWDAPWRFEGLRRSGGSGFAIKGKRIMTNAHVVSWARQIIVRRYQDARPFLAEVEFIAHDCDLAVLTVRDERFFDNLEPLEFGDLPKVRSAVVTCGYPAGGEEISYTRGVVSRVQIEPYSHIGNRHLLSVQTDAAINPGNSGGPVLQDDKVVGVAFQGISGLENTGFFIPTLVMEHFLKDVADGKYDGFPLAAIRLVSLQNPAYRKLLGLQDTEMGARIDGFKPGSKATSLLQAEDVLLKVGSFPVASDGTILYEGNRLSGALGFQFAQSGECVPVQVWRDGKMVELSLPVYAYDSDRASGNQYDVLPRYYIYGGLVFTPLSLDFLKTLGGSPMEAPGELLYELAFRPFEAPSLARPEPVVLASVLADEANANVTSRGRLLVDRINGIRIEKLEDVVRAFESNTTPYDQIEFLPRQYFECLDRAELNQATSRILKNYSIPADRRL